MDEVRATQLAGEPCSTADRASFRSGRHARESVTRSVVLAGSAANHTLACGISDRSAPRRAAITGTPQANRPSAVGRGRPRRGEDGHQGARMAPPDRRSGGPWGTGVRDCAPPRAEADPDAEADTPSHDAPSARPVGRGSGAARPSGANSDVPFSDPTRDGRDQAVDRPVSQPLRAPRPSSDGGRARVTPVPRLPPHHPTRSQPGRSAAASTEASIAYVH